MRSKDPDQQLESEFSPPDNWDEIVKKDETRAGFCQTTSWRRIQTVFNKKTPVFLSNDNLDKSLGFIGAQCFISEVIDKSIIKMLLRKFHFLAGSTIEIREGPVIHATNTDAEIELFHQFIHVVEDFCQKKHIDWITSSGLNHTNPLANSSTLKDLLQKEGFTVSLWATYIIDLSPEQDFLYKKLDHHVRARIRKASENQISIHHPETREEYLEKFVRVFNSLQILNERPERPEDSFLGFWEERESINYHPFYATAQDGEIIGVLGSYQSNGVTTEVTSALHPRCHSEKLPAQDLLHWEQIVAAKNDGARYFDLAGVNPDPRNSKESGIKNFKAKWGGQYITFFRYEKCLNKRYEFIKRALQTIKHEDATEIDQV
jgi:lipid II:glycine glycyltransferase (peptidoglycan interpeptide bridge formation enzyme)